eukprot:355627-Chlamydomonas_euryale.AAC.13
MRACAQGRAAAPLLASMPRELGAGRACSPIAARLACTSGTCATRGSCSPCAQHQSPGRIKDSCNSQALLGNVMTPRQAYLLVVKHIICAAHATHQHSLACHTSML